MNLDIRTEPLVVTLFGASTIHDPNKSYGEEIRSLLDRVWPVVRAGELKHKGINWVVYDAGLAMFAGVEIENAGAAAEGLEQRTIRLERYVICKHVGPYHLLGQTGDALKAEMQARGLAFGPPHIEVYGHWNDDPLKLETDLIHALRN